jgi:hypothetical protein
VINTVIYGMAYGINTDIQLDVFKNSVFKSIWVFKVIIIPVTSKTFNAP